MVAGGGGGRGGVVRWRVGDGMRNGKRRGMQETRHRWVRCVKGEIGRARFVF